MAIYCEHQKPRGHCKTCTCEPVKYVITKGNKYVKEAKKDLTGFHMHIETEEEKALTFSSEVDAQAGAQFINDNTAGGWNVRVWHCGLLKTKYIISLGNLWLYNWGAGVEPGFNNYTFCHKEKQALKFPSWEKAKQIAELFDGFVFAVK